MYWLPYTSHASHHPSQTPCLPWISYATQKLMLDSCKMVEKQSEAFHIFPYMWQRSSCGLVYCPGGNATDPIWRVLASSDRISCWTPLKPQHSNLNPLANQLWCTDILTPLIIPHRLPWISYATQKLMLDSCKMLQKQQSEAFHTFLWHFFQV